MTEPAEVTLVPMSVEALVANNPVCLYDTFFRCGLSFTPGERAHPQQNPFDVDQPMSVGGQVKPERIGIYLHWQLPEALCHARMDLTGNTPEDITFPPVPARWLVVRYLRPTATEPLLLPAAGWVVQSDYLQPDTSGATTDEGTSSYLYQDKARRIGRKHDLRTAPWQEPSQPGVPLTAMGPGVPTFATYQPYNEDVFSLHDPLVTDSDHGQLINNGVISYLVVGWHAHPDDDPLHPQRIADLLDFHCVDDARRSPESLVATAFATLGWDRPDTATTAGGAQRLLYVGTVLGITWERDPSGTEVPLSPRPSHPFNDVNIGVGHTSADALDALVRDAQITPPPPPTGTPPTGIPGRDGPDPGDPRTLLNAFHCGMLDVLDKALGDSAAALRTALHREWFRESPGGYTWRLDTDPSTNGMTTGPGGPAGAGGQDDVIAALKKLNATQQQLDQALRDEAAWTRRAYDVWWMQGLADDTHLEFSKAAQDYLDTTLFPHLDQARADITRLIADRDVQAARLRPPGEAEQTTARLRAVPRQPFHDAVDPVSCVCGTGVAKDRSLPRPTPLPTRNPSQLVTTATLDGTTFQAPQQPPEPLHFPDLDPVLADAGVDWSVITSLLAEFWVLDAAASHLRATETPQQPCKDCTIADAPDPLTRLTPPPGHQVAEYTALWCQPWSPVFLLWEAEVYQLPFMSDRDPTTFSTDWTFVEGQLRLTSRPDPKTVTSTVVQGRCCVSPLPILTLRRRITSHLDTYPDCPTEKMRELGETQVAIWELVSQALDGTNAQLVRRRPAFPDPSPDWPLDPRLAATRPATVPYPDADQRFQPVRAAQFAFTEVILADRFGRAIWLVPDEPSAYVTYRPHRADSMTSDVVAATKNTYRFVHLPPRLPQPARLSFDLLSAQTTTATPIDPDADPTLCTDTPVCGWVLLGAGGTAPPHDVGTEDRSLTVYDPSGRGLGTTRIIGPDTRRAVGWLPLPDSALVTPQDLFTDSFTTAHPHLAGFLHALIDADAYAYGQGNRDSPKPQRMHELLTAIDHALLTITPARDDQEAIVTRLAGRPLALVRARLHLDLDGPPLSDTTWDNALQEPDPHQHPLWTLRWNVQIGDYLDPTDGLIGYYTAATLDAFTPTDYDHLYVEDTPTGQLTYLRPITDGSALALPARPGTDLDFDATRYLTLLIDPWATVHARTDILPETTLRLPETTISDVLHRLRLAIPTGPVLTTPRTLTRPNTTPRTDTPPRAENPTTASAGRTSDSDTVDTVVLPAANEPHRTGRRGQWAERTAHQWATLPICAADNLAHLPGTRPVARTGFLDLVPLKDSPSAPDGESP